MLFIKKTKYYFFIAIFLVLFKSIANASGLNSDTTGINSLLASAKVSLDSNNYFKSFHFAKTAFDQSNILDYTYGKAKSLLIIGQIQSYKGIKDSSLNTLKHALSLFKEINNESCIGDAYNSIGTLFSDIGSQDSAEFYYNEALKVRQLIKDKIGIVGSYNNLGIIYFHRGMYAKALEYYFLSLSLLDELNNKKIQSSILNNIGGVFWNQGDYTKALEFFLKSLKIEEELKDIKRAALINNNVGTVYRQMGDINMALKFYNISLNKSQSIGDSASMSPSLMGIGDIFHEKGDYKSALESYLVSENIRKKHSNFLGLANLYVSMGILYKDMGQKEKALKTLEEAQNIYIRLNEPWGKSKSLIQIGELYSEQGLTQKSIEKCNLGINIAKQIRALDLIKEGYQILNKIYEQVGNNIQAYNTFKLYIAYRDSINGIEKTKQIFRLQLQADFDKVLNKQKVEQENKLGLAQLKSVKQTKIANIFILAFAITLSVFIVFFINNRQKQRNSNLLAFQKLDMERQKTELTAQRDELQIQKDLVIHQRDKIMTMLTDLGESIDYARKIQQALLPSDKTLEKTLGEYFLFFQPRESVGGDFYWVAQNEQITYFAVADCTGHGVPGGFMSMLGVSLLNELVSRSECSSPAKMLWNLRELIMKALSQTGLDEDSQDGMDIALCMYNSNNRHLVYAGANLSLFLVTPTPPQANDRVYVQDNLVELKADRMPVSYYLRMIEFNEHNIVLNPGDCLYLFSDGYSDQFGGPNNKKFGYTTFRNLLLSTSNKPFNKQKDILWNEFDKWKGEENQTDDVIVMGIKIT